MSRTVQNRGYPLIRTDEKPPTGSRPSLLDLQEKSTGTFSSPIHRASDKHMRSFLAKMAAFLKPKRRWFQYSLRTLLVIMVIVACVLSWKMNQLHKRRSAVEAIKALGGHVSYNYQFDANNSPIEGNSPGPDWLCRLAGDDFFASVVGVSLSRRDIADVTPLADLPNLKWVGLSTTSVSDLTPLAELADLRKLDLLTTQVSDLSPLSKLTNLEGLILDNTAVRDVSPLAEMSKLQWLRLLNTQVTDVSALGNLTSLYELSLAFAPVDDVTPLGTLKNLEWLDLSDTQVSDVTPLRELPKLVFLSLSRTRVTDIAPLANLPRLRFLHIRGTSVSDQQVQELQQALPKCKITK